MGDHQEGLWDKGEEPSQEKKGPQKEAQGPPKETAASGTAGGLNLNEGSGQGFLGGRTTGSPRDQGPWEDGTDNDGTNDGIWPGTPLPKQAPRPNRSCRSGAKSQEQDLVVVCHVRDGAGGKQPGEGAEVSLGHGAHGVLSEDGAALGGQMGILGGEESGSPSAWTSGSAMA